MNKGHAADVGSTRVWQPRPCRMLAVQCDNNHNLALEKLLELQSEEPANSSRPAAPPPALQTRQVRFFSAAAPAVD